MLLFCLFWCARNDQLCFCLQLRWTYFLSPRHSLRTSPASFVKTWVGNLYRATGSEHQEKDFALGPTLLFPLLLSNPESSPKKKCQPPHTVPRKRWKGRGQNRRKTASSPIRSSWREPLKTANFKLPTRPSSPELKKMAEPDRSLPLWQAKTMRLPRIRELLPRPPPAETPRSDMGIRRGSNPIRTLDLQPALSGFEQRRGMLARASKKRKAKRGTLKISWCCHPENLKLAPRSLMEHRLCQVRNLFLWMPPFSEILTTYSVLAMFQLLHCLLPTWSGRSPMRAHLSLHWRSWSRPTRRTTSVSRRNWAR